MEKYLDDRVINPDRLKNMSKEELKQEIININKLNANLTTLHSENDKEI